MNTAAQQHRHGALARAVTLALAVGFAVVGNAGAAGADSGTTTGTKDCSYGSTTGTYDDCEVPVPVVPPVDECGPGNAHYGTVPEGPWTVEVNSDGSLTITADEGYDFPDDETVIEYPVLIDSNEPCVTPPPPPPPVVVPPPPPVVTVVPPVVTPPEVAPAEARVVRAATRQIDKCGRASDMFRVAKRSGVVYRVNGKVVREGVWLKARTRAVTVRARAAGATYDLRGQQVWRMTFSTRPCAQAPEVAPDTGA